MPCVRFFEEVFIAPARFRGAEYEINKASERQKVVRHDEIFDVLNVSDALNAHATPQIEAQRTRQAQNNDDCEINDDAFLSAPAVFVHCKGDDVLENRDDRRKSRE